MFWEDSDEEMGESKILGWRKAGKNAAGPGERPIVTKASSSSSSSFIDRGRMLLYDSDEEIVEKNGKKEMGLADERRKRYPDLFDSSSNDEGGEERHVTHSKTQGKESKHKRQKLAEYSSDDDEEDYDRIAYSKAHAKARKHKSKKRVAPVDADDSYDYGSFLYKRVGASKDKSINDKAEKPPSRIGSYGAGKVVSFLLHANVHFAG